MLAPQQRRRKYQRRGFDEGRRQGGVVADAFLVDDLARRAALGLQYPRIVEQRCKVHGPVLRTSNKWMARRRNDRNLLLPDGPEEAFRAGRIAGAGQAADHDIQAAVAQQFDQPVAGVDHHLHRQQGIDALGFQQGNAQAVGESDHDAADVDLLRAALAQLGQFVPQRGHRAAQAAAGVHHGQAGRIESEPTALAVEQRLANGGFELVQHLARG